jgi:hypothetical protein
MLASFSVLLRLHCRTHSYFRKKNVNFLLQQPRKQSQGGLMMLGGGSSGQRPASGSVMLLPSKIMPPNVPQPERSIAAEHLVSPAPEAGPKRSEEKKKHKKKRGKATENDAVLPTHEPGKTPIFVDDVETKAMEPEPVELKSVDAESLSKPLTMLSGGAVPKNDGSSVTPTSAALLAQGEVPEPKPKLLPLYEEETALEFADDAGALERRRDWFLPKRLTHDLCRVSTPSSFQEAGQKRSLIPEKSTICSLCS